MDPITRKETFLAKAGGQDVTTPTPITREEYFLDQIAKGGGSGGGVMVATSTNDGTTTMLNKTWQEIRAAISADIPCFVKYNIDGELYMNYVSGCFYEDGLYTVTVGAGGTSDYMEYNTDSAGGYPASE